MHKCFLMLRKFFNHGWTPMDTDSVASIRVYPCSSVVDTFRLRPGRGEFIGGWRKLPQDRRLAGVKSGAMAPRLMMNLMPSATDISNLVISCSGTSTRKPLVGLGVVGTN